MFGTRWRLFHLFGIPISLDLSWLLILILLTYSMTNMYSAELEGRINSSQAILMGLTSALIFFTCIVLHEMGHALVARAMGIPIKGITLFLFGGVAELQEEPRSAGSEFLMAIAGPIVSAVLAGIFFLLWGIGSLYQWPEASLAMLKYLGGINLTVLIFNMVPAFPLDGGRVLRSFLWAVSGNLRQATYWASLAGRGFAWLLIGVGALAVIQGWWGGLWFAVIGLFLNSAARGSYQHLLVRQTLEGEPVRRFMNTDPISVSPDISLHTWVEDYVYRHHRKGFPVVSHDQLVGYVSTQMLSGYPRNEWDVHTVGDIMEEDLDEISVAPDSDAMEALTRMQRTGSSRLIVVDGDHLVGVVSLKDLMRFLQLKLELEGDGEEKRPPRPRRREESEATEDAPWVEPAKPHEEESDARR